MSGIKIAALYGIYPFELGFCGPQDKKSRETFTRYLLDGTSEKEVRNILEGFEGAYPYYKRISKGNNIDNPFDDEVVRAYWIGNKLLDKVPNAHHSFHVFVVGSVTGRIELKGKLLDICRVSWGEVVAKKNNKVIVRYQPIEKKGNKYILTDFIDKSFFWKKDFIPKIEIGDKVSCHWNHVVEVISQKDIDNLEKYTNLTLDNI